MKDKAKKTKISREKEEEDIEEEEEVCCFTS